MNLSLMIKPASSLCNLRCRYCFYHDLADHREIASYGIMQEPVLRRLLERALEALPPGRNELSLIFQGGEPMLAGLDYFEKLEAILETMKPSGIRIHRSLQTNGTLIDERWAQFFAKHGYLLGVSLDGPAAIQNDLRVDANGKGSFSKVMSGIALLKRHGVEFNILSVVTAEVARHGQKVYSFMRKNGWNYLQLIPCMDPISGHRQDFSLTPEQYGRFLIDVFQLYEEERRKGIPVSVRWFDNLLDMAIGRAPESCGMTGVCACHFVVEADGSVYPCDFYVDDAHRLGRVDEMGFREMFECGVAHSFVKESLVQAEKCQNCRWFGLCRGGCRRYRELEAENALGLNRLCRAYEIFFSACYDRVFRLAHVLETRW
ncbi:MAG: anaerobic sulfatase maturase [Clostridia bacterium]|nr:anaerobic sulfatase maturase [Clostridia bacterium]